MSLLFGNRPAISVDRITPTRLGTVLVPFQDMKGNKVVAEFTRKMWREMHAEVREAFAVIDREAETQAVILAIERHESVV